MPDPDRTGEDAVDEAAAGERDRTQTDADDERHPTISTSDSPDLPDDWFPA